ncbi:MAG TPA: site-2 protease family protein [Terriglobales bacterium]|jgi:membrane-associated protease RseP (regulator of RpoE activity)|nr:site-2 protease family protein [Terriglobales bacterium]
MSDFDPQNPLSHSLDDRLADLRARPEIIWVQRPPRRRYWLHALLLFVTVLTTLTVGSRLQFNFDHALPAYSTDTDYLPFLWAWQRPARLLLGLPFSATLLLILLAHEMGHFAYCVRHRVYATLPFFIPAPTLIGTLGAFIRIRSPIPSRRALFDIGIAGPIAGFLLAVPALAFGMTLSRVAPDLVAASDVQFGHSLIFYLLRGLAPQTAAPWRDLYLHPVAMAAWVGMLATTLNLIPGGQLDGGHIVYALFPRAHRWISRATVLLLAGFGLRFWPGWLMWGLVVLFTGTRHPSVPLEPDLDAPRKLLAITALLIFLLTFMPSPIPGHGIQEFRQMLHGQ